MEPTTQPTTTSPQTPTTSFADQKPKQKKSLVVTIVALFLVIGIGLGAFLYMQPKQEAKKSPTAERATPGPTLPVHQLIGNPNAPIQLTYAIHWTEKFQTDGIYENGQLKSKGLKQYLEEYVLLHPEVAFQIQVIQYGDYASKLQLLHDAGTPPDIYQIYAPWGVSYVKNNVLAEPPVDIVNDIKTQYVSNAGPTIAGKIWGFPTEVNTYSLLYNKELLRQAGITAPPQTFDALIQDAIKTTKYDQNGNITQYGIAFLKGNDWQVVDPFLAWLFSDNGQFLSSDFSQALFNSSAGKEVLSGELTLFNKKVTDNNGNFFDFKDGKVAYVISPPWTKALIQEGFKDKFASTVGVAPLPYFKKPATLQYSWFMGVMAKSQHKKEAWEFLKWFNTEVQPATNTTRYGDLLANTINAIPSRKIDLDNHKNLLSDPFMKVFVDQIPNSVAEPNVANASIIKKILMGQIEAVWAGQKTSDEGLKAATDEINQLLKDNQ